MLYLKGKYGIGPAQPLRLAPGAVIMAEDGAEFVAFGGNTKGITFTAGSERAAGWLSGCGAGRAMQQHHVPCSRAGQGMPCTLGHAGRETKSRQHAAWCSSSAARRLE